MGLAVGITVALFASRLLSGLLFGVERSDPLTYAMSGLALLAVAAVAAWWPARRATRVDPLTTLRAQ